MSEKLFLTAPAGNIGGAAVARLVERGAPVSVLALPADVPRLPEAVRAHVDLHVGSLADAEAVAAASRDAAGMLLILPPVLDVDDAIAATEVFAANALAAIAANGIEHVAFVSSQGAGSSAAKLIAHSYELEDRLRAAAPNVRALRPGPLMENFLMEVEPLAAGLLPLVAAATTPMHLTAAGDVGRVIADLLADRSWTSFEAVPLRGPDVLTPPEVAERIAAITGRAIAYVPITAGELVDEMVKFGLAPGAARTVAEVFEQAAGVDYGDSPGTVVTPTPFDAFVRGALAPALNGS